ncbi:hypothetical protein DICVIV_06726 [Dictyocaulus viviparus]|uniref:Late nodulin n=1 Tax=Dictyocaulus viviparus TaxID=29172 RepID=A0A0D8XTY5_DICVI|nr:hypothetical protein DICVIV_06726 [Dictyocaulus viviparus]
MRKNTMLYCITIMLVVLSTESLPFLCDDNGEACQLHCLETMHSLVWNCVYHTCVCHDRIEPYL